MARVESIPVKSIWVRAEPNTVIVEVELEDGRWYEVIRDVAEIHESTVSHCVSASGIAAIQASGNAVER